MTARGDSKHHGARERADANFARFQRAGEFPTVKQFMEAARLSNSFAGKYLRKKREERDKMNEEELHIGGRWKRQSLLVVRDKVTKKRIEKLMTPGCPTMLDVTYSRGGKDYSGNVYVRWDEHGHIECAVREETEE